MRGITPGDYKLFAWEALEPFAYFDSGLVQKFESQAKPVHITESGKLTVEVSVITSIVLVGAVYDRPLPEFDKTGYPHPALRATLSRCTAVQVSWPCGPPPRMKRRTKHNLTGRVWMQIKWGRGERWPLKKIWWTNPVSKVVRPT
jgi:hypothetical protein